MSFSNVLRWHIPKTVQDGLILEEIGSRTKVKVDHEKKLKKPYQVIQNMFLFFQYNTVQCHDDTITG